MNHQAGLQHVDLIAPDPVSGVYRLLTSKEWNMESGAKAHRPLRQAQGGFNHHDCRQLEGLDPTSSCRCSCLFCRSFRVAVQNSSEHPQQHREVVVGSQAVWRLLPVLELTSSLQTS